jgi:Fe-S oxidoreductase
MCSAGLIPSDLTHLAENIVTKDNILGTPKETGAKWAKDLHIPRETETIFFAGCGYQYADKLGSWLSSIEKEDSITTETADLSATQQRQAVATRTGTDVSSQPLCDAVKVLRTLGVEFSYMAEEEPCCGGPLYYIGLHSRFGKHARQTHSKLKARRVKHIIGIVPECTYALGKLIPDFTEGFDIEVKHFCQVVSGKIDSVELRFPREAKAVYHDPCQMARYLELTEELRQILRAVKGIDLVETEWTNKEWTTCCGGGPGFEFVFPELSRLLAANRARELVETGAEIIVTQCPTCIKQLKAGLQEINASHVEVLDLAQVLAAAMKI